MALAGVSIGVVAGVVVVVGVKRLLLTHQPTSTILTQ
jgi:hypothetical protein